MEAFKNCFLETDKGFFKIFAMIKIRVPAIKKRMAANEKAGISATAILLSIYVEPQMTYIAKKANSIKILLLFCFKI